jgi:hypothetical protein
LAFEAVVRLGSVTRAAEELCLAQPTVSCMLRKLADTVGGPVIVIRERRVEPTDVGRELVALCHAMQGAMVHFEERLPQALGYDRLAQPAPPAPDPDSLPWPSLSPPAARSRWRQRASQCPRAKRRLSGADGAS